MAHQSFSKRVLDALTDAALKGDGEVETGDLSSLLFLQTRESHKKMLNTLSDLARNGRILRVRQGVYTPNANTKKPDKREVMWRVLRMRGGVTVADLQEMAGVSSCYAKEWLRILVERGVAIKVVPQDKNNPHSWRLIKTDIAEMPVDTKKAARLRKIRRLKKEQIARKLDQIDDNSRLIRNILETMEDGDDTENI